MSGSAIVLGAVTVGVIAMVARPVCRLAWGVSKLAFVAVLVVATVAAVKSSHRAAERAVDRQYAQVVTRPHSIKVNGHEIEIPRVEVQLPDLSHVAQDLRRDLSHIGQDVRRDVQRELDRELVLDPRVHGHHSVSVEHRFSDTWACIAAGVVALIIGSVLVRRGRGARTIKLISLLGVGAIIYSVVSFFDNPPRTIVSRDRVIKSSDIVNRDESRTVVRPEKPKRTQRAKRPTSRPRQEGEAASAKIDELPPRSGEIPVAAELAIGSDDKPQSPQSPAPAASAASESEAPTPVAAAAQASAPAAPEVTEPAPPSAPPAPVAAPAQEIAAPSAPVETPQPVPPAPVEAAVAPAAAVPAPPAESEAPIAKSKGVDETPAARRSASKPDWVDAPPRFENSIYSISASSGLFVSVPECQRELNARLKRDVDHYIEEYLGEGAAQLADVPLSYIKQHLEKAEFSEVVLSDSVGPMHQLHAQLAIDDNARNEFHRRWHDAMVTDRLWYTGAGAAMLLALLSTFYGYLKLDLRTGGAQKTRLQLAATLVALLVAASVFLVRWAVPF
ncbi:MAG TPA: hypothetical protein VL175_17540 [Pirellulales bacterium]|jgi:hypothetical protein|nr:hypothetical protein [Pirellulales bacterium]